jgi:type IV pilus assembly protein PilM
MIPWIPLSVLSDLTQPGVAPLDDVQPRNPLGFSDVRAQAAPALADEVTVDRRPIGFAPAPVAQPSRSPLFRTELSFRRTPVARAQAGAGAHEPLDAVGHAEAVEAADARDELWPNEPPASPADEAEERKSFFKRERKLFRRKAQAEGLQADGAEPAHAVEPTGDLDEPVAEALEPVAEAHEDIEAETPEEPAAHADVPVLDLSDIDDASDKADADHRDDGFVDIPEAPVVELPEVVADAASTDDADGDLWEGDAEPEAPASEDATETQPDQQETVVAVAVSGPKEKRSLRSRGGAPKAEKRSSGRRDRGGRKVVGLKIGASQLAAAVVQQVDGRSELVQAARVPLEPGIVVDGDVRDSVALANALKSFFESAGLPRKDVRIGLASNRIGVRATDVVGIDDPERFDNAVRFKAHEVLPVAVHESVLDYRVIDERASEDGESLRRVLLVVAPRDQIEPYLEVCREAGIRLAGVDLEALGLLRAFVEPRSFATRQADDTATVVVSIGHEASTLLVAGGGACEFTRVFDWGGGTLQEAIAQELDVHAAEATTILRHLALSGTSKPLASLDDESRQRALDAVRSRLTPFARELVSSLQFYQTQPESLGIGEIVITGGTSHLVGLADALHQMIGVNVRVGDPLQRVVARSALDSSLEATIGSLAVPIGLAIEDDAVRSVNLLPSEMRQSGRKKPDLVSIAIPVAAAASIAALGFMFMQANGTTSDRQAELDAVQAEIAALPKPKRPVIDPGVAADEAQRAVALAGVLGGRISWDGVLRDVSLVLPGNVSLTTLTAQLPAPTPAGTPAAPAATPAAVPTAPALPTGVTVEGYTKDQRSVAVLLARLRTVPSLTNVQLQSSTREVVAKKPIVRFVVLADIKQPGGAQ